MKNLIDKIIIKLSDLIYKKQQLDYQKRKNKLNKKLLSGNICGEKIHTINGATLSIKNDTQKKDKEFQENIEKIVEKCINNPEKLISYIKGAKTPVYKVKYAKKLLSKINEVEGFILPKTGLCALYLNLFLNKKISFKTSEMFVISSYDLNIYALIYQFYNWYCYKMKLEGFDNKTQAQFKHVFEICETSKINTLSFDEILNMKSAVKRDIEAIDFVKKMSIKFDMSKQNLEKIKQGKKITV